MFDAEAVKKAVTETEYFRIRQIIAYPVTEALQCYQSVSLPY